VKFDIHFDAIKICC